MRIAHDLVTLLSFRIDLSRMEISVLSTVDLFKPDDCCFPVSIYWDVCYLTERAKSKFDFIFNLSCFPWNFLLTLNRQVLDVYRIFSVFNLSRWKFWHVNERLLIWHNFRRLSWLLLTFSQKQIFEIHLMALNTINLHLILCLYSLLLQYIFDLQ